MTNLNMLPRFQTISIFAVVFALTAFSPNPSSAQTYAVIHTFPGGAGGAAPYAGVVVDQSGNLYGTTAAGGGGGCDGQEGAGCGIAYELQPNGLFTPLWQFAGSPNDGAGPTTALLGPGRSLYVITAGGGNGCHDRNYLDVPGCGTIIRLSPPTGPTPSAREYRWIETILYKFQFSDGASPVGNLAMDSVGNLYGTTNLGGAVGPGTVFELSSSKGIWNETVLHNFQTGDGEYPFSGVTLDATGNLYGTTESGGGFDFGEVFQLVAASSWSENTLHSFTCGSDGCMPTAGVTLDSSGDVYGSTPGIECSGGDAGNAFELTAGSWSYSSLYCFSGGDEAGPLLSSLLFDHSGNLYGTTQSAGANGWGSVFKLTPSNGTWTYTSLHDFTGGSDGGYPVGNLAFDASGNLYGTASIGGTAHWCCGVIFKISDLPKSGDAQEVFRSPNTPAPVGPN